jgi:hypothetical protein
MAVDLSTLKPVLYFFNHAVILLNSVFVKFSASPTVFPQVTSIKLSVNATALVCFTKSKFSNDLYWMFQHPGPHQHGPWGHPLLVSLSILMLLVDRIAVL